IREPLRLPRYRIVREPEVGAHARPMKLELTDGGDDVPASSPRSDHIAEVRIDCGERLGPLPRLLRRESVTQRGDSSRDEPGEEVIVIVRGSPLDKLRD